MPSVTRRGLLAALGSASVALAGCLSRGTSAGDLGGVEGEWPVVGRDRGHTRFVGEGPTDPETVWTTELDGARSVGTPSLADGRLYVPVDAVSDRARHRHHLHALDAATGEERWRVPLRADPNPSPAIVGDFAVVTARRGSDRGRIVAFRPRYGDEEWLHDVDARVTAPPVTDGVDVYVPDWEGRVHALSISDGSVRWSRSIGADGESRTFAEPVAVRDGTLYLGSLSGVTGLIAADAEIGDERWTRSTDGVVAGPVVDDALVAVRTRRAVEAFEPDGTRRFGFALLGRGGEPLALDDRRLYVPAEGILHAITRNGEEAWTHETRDGERIGPPTVVGDSVVVREGGELTALSRDDGTPRWTVDAGGSGEVLATPEAVFATGPGGRVVALGDA